MIELKNGRPVLRDKVSKRPEEFLVIAQLDDNHHPYVVWRVNKQGETYLGDYCKTLEEATEIFDTRH